MGERGNSSQHKFAICTQRTEQAFETLRILAAHKQTGAASGKGKTFYAKHAMETFPML